ncbi:hypothetical protein BJ085DRAFT_40705 [Dimargaris cristalligena]|uniref:Uncharacterized protein n=1 Tax=Dimargaris cristalligena TaxID=215637 RepID=A0A4P9ZRW2_9FUNG|nr:hypothetical protein BJ085DRAFT_40705 [Dimargaris cristalligena]|eukprot:RKP36296.1 hypothetical protein BJ085DRAFT_40705 [Dimargaris cristalligena]
MLHRLALYGALVVSVIVAGQGQAELNDHPAGAQAQVQALARRTVMSWFNTVQRDYRDSKYRYSRYLQNHGLKYNDRSWRQKRLSYTDERFKEKTRTRTAENSNENFNSPVVKAYDFLVKLAPRPKVANIENVVTEQPKPKPNPDPQLVGAPSQTRPLQQQQQQQQQPPAISNNNAPDNGQETVHPQVQAQIQAPVSFPSAPNESGPSMPNNGRFVGQPEWQSNNHQPPNWSHNQPAPAPQQYPLYTNQGAQQSVAQPPPNGYLQQFPVTGGSNYPPIIQPGNQNPNTPIHMSQEMSYNRPIHAGPNQLGNYVAQTGNWDNS